MGKDKVDIGLIRQYIRGELSPKEMYALERQAQDDPALMDVILGMESETEDVHGANMEDIRRRIASRTRHDRVRRLAPIQRWAIAATVLVAFSLGTLWFTQWRSFEQKPEVASAPTDTGEQRLATSGTPESRDEAVSEEAVKVPQSKISVREEPKAVKQDQKRLTLQTKKQAQPTDTLDQVVVVGYGRQKKMSLTGAVAEVDPPGESTIAPMETEKLDTPVQINEQALAGRTPVIRIRGMGHAPQGNEHRVVIGKVVDEETQKPIQGVALEIMGDSTLTTDAQGRFAVPDTPKTLTASYIGYEQQTVNVTGLDSITIALRPADAELNEVVVVGYGRSKHQTESVNATPRESKPEPEDGWRTYRRYLKDKRKLADGQRGTVDLEFTIDKAGGPTNIKVIKSTNGKLDSIAIAIVREGPKWKAGKNGERKTELQVTF